MTISSEDIPASLHFSSDCDAGLRRRRAGRGFAYLSADGRPVRDDVTLARIRALAVPPAWTDVWICRDPRGHLQATGRDARGRKQYRYHAEWREARDRQKFGDLLEFGEALPAIRRRVEADLRRADVSREAVLATVTALLDETLVRVGNEEYARANASYGLTTLRSRHVRLGRDAVRFVFKGKSGLTHDVTLHDRRLARAVRNCHQLPGQLLFQYDDGGELHAVHSHDVNDYLRSAAGLDVTAKQFRTWRATALAAADLGSRPAPGGPAAATRVTRDVVASVAERLGNTPAVCRASYLHPGVLAAFESGDLARWWAESPPRRGRSLDADERRLLLVLRRLRRAGPRLLAAA
jgi:DNA topoisomerase-1